MYTLLVNVLKNKILLLKIFEIFNHSGSETTTPSWYPTTAPVPDLPDPTSPLTFNELVNESDRIYEDETKIAKNAAIEETYSPRTTSYKQEFQYFGWGTRSGQKTETGLPSKILLNECQCSFYVKALMTIII